ncbi:MAG: hypothetical protein IPL95_10675 [Saprospiraceae bacterium]|nr:hypothetical protein [Saprospiraceae bacterium]
MELNVIVDDANPDPPVSGSLTVTINPDVETPIFLLGPTSVRCQENSSVTYTATANNSTSISYSLTPPSAGNINSSNGTVNYNTNFNGLATITATALGCKGPKSATHNATTKALPTVSTGSNQTICQNGTTNGLGGVVGGSATGGVWTSDSGGTFNPSDNTLNATWTAPNGFTGTAMLTLTTTGMDPCVAVSKKMNIIVISQPSASISYNSGQPICSNTGNYNPTITGTNGGTFTSTPSGLTISSNGIINSGTSSPGTYTVTYTITANGGCPVFTTTTTVVISSVGNVTITTDKPGNTVCFGSNITLTASPSGMQYSWSTGDITNPITNNNLPVGTNNVSVTVTNSSGCTRIGNINVIVNAIPPAPNISASKANPLCTGENVSLMANGTGNFIWTGPNGFNSNQQNPTLTNLTLNNEGTYNCKITVNSCTSIESSLFLEVNETPNITNIVQSNSITTCGGCEGVISINGLQSNTLYTIAYSKNGNPQPEQSIQTNNLGSLLLTNLCKGVYSNFNLRLNGCSRSNNTSITLSDPPLPSIPTTNQQTNRSFCADTFPITLSVNPISGIEMNWYKDGSLFVSNQNSLSINDAGIYEVEAVNSISRCISATKLRFTIGKVQNPNPPTVNQSDVIKCQNEIPVTLSATPPSNASVFWFSQPAGGSSIANGNSLQHTNSMVNTYFYYVESKLTTSPQCKSLSRSEIKVTVNANPIAPSLPLNAKDTSYFCQSEIPSNSTISVNTTNGNSINWYQTASGGVPIQSGSNVFIHQNSSVGVYSYFAETENNLTGCKSTSRKRIVVVVKPTPQITSIPDKEFCVGDQVLVNFASNPTGSTFTWKNNNSKTGLNSLSGNGNITFLGATNNTANEEISTISAIPTLNGCVGDERNFVNLILNPTPQLVKISESTCSNLVYNFPDFTISPQINGTQNYSWKNLNNSIPGLGANGVGQINPFTIPDNNSGNNINGLIEYQVLVKCPSKKDTLKLTIFPKPAINNTINETSGSNNNDKVICENDKVTISTEGSNSVSPYSYFWSNNSTSNIITDFPQGPVSGFTNKTYTVTVTDKNNCTNVTSTTIEINKYPNVDITLLDNSGVGTNDKIICSKDKIDLEANESGGSRPQYQFQWNVNNSTTKKISLNPIISNIQQELSYKVTLTNSGCKVVDSINVTVFGLPIAKYQVITSELEPNTCIAFKDLSIKNGGFNINNWKWNFQSAKRPVIDTNINTSVCAEFSKPGKYGVSLKVTDINNCMSTINDSININNSNCPINFRDNFQTKYCLDKATNTVIIKLEIEQKVGFTSEMVGNFDNLSSDLTWKTKPMIGGSSAKIYPLEIIATKQSNFTIRLNISDPNNPSDGCRQITIAQNIDVFDAPEGTAFINDNAICKGNNSFARLTFKNGAAPFRFKFNSIDSIANDTFIVLGITPNDYKNATTFNPCLSYLKNESTGCENKIINFCPSLKINQLPKIDTLSKTSFCQNQQDSSTIIHSIPNGSSSFLYEWNYTDSRITINPKNQKKALITLEKDKTGEIPIKIKVTDVKTGCFDTMQNTIIISKGEAPKIDTISKIFALNSDPSKGFVLIYPDPNLCYLWEEDSTGSSGFKPANCNDSNANPYCEPSNNNLNQNAKFQVKIWFKVNGVCPEFSTTCFNTATQSRNASFQQNITLPLQLILLPNPNDGNFSIKMADGIKGNYRTAIIDNVGKVVYKTNLLKQYDEVKIEMNYEILPTGLYHLQLIDEEGNSYLLKFIVQH